MRTDLAEDLLHVAHVELAGDHADDLLFVLAELLGEFSLRSVSDYSLDWIRTFLVEFDARSVFLYICDHIVLCFIHFCHDVVVLLINFPQSVLFYIVNFSLETVEARDVVNGAPLLLLEHFKASGDHAGLALDAFINLGEFSHFAVDDIVGVLGHGAEDSLSLFFDLSKLIPDDIFALLCHHQLNKGFSILLVQLLEDVASTARSHCSHVQDMF